MVYLSHCFPQHNHIPTAYWSFVLHCHKCWMLIMRIKVDLIIHDNNIPIPTMQFWALIPRNIQSENDAVHVYVYHCLSRDYQYTASWDTIWQMPVWISWRFPYSLLWFRVFQPYIIMGQLFMLFYNNLFRLSIAFAQFFFMIHPEKKQNEMFSKF